MRREDVPAVAGMAAQLDNWTAGQLRASKQLPGDNEDTRAARQLDKRTTGRQDERTQDRWTTGQLDKQTAGPPGLLDNWTTGPPDNWTK